MACDPDALTAACESVRATVERKKESVEQLMAERLHKSYPYVILITGARGSGKTALFASLCGALSASEWGPVDLGPGGPAVRLVPAQPAHGHTAAAVSRSWQTSETNVNTVRLAVRADGAAVPDSVTMSVWDVRKAESAFYYGAKCVIVVFSSFDRASFVAAQQIIAAAQSSSRPGVVFILVDNDLGGSSAGAARTSEDEVAAYCEAHGIARLRVPGDCPASVGALADHLRASVAAAMADPTAEQSRQLLARLAHGLSRDDAAATRSNSASPADRGKPDDPNPPPDPLRAPSRMHTSPQAAFEHPPPKYPVGAGPNTLFPVTGVPLDETVSSLAAYARGLAAAFAAADADGDGLISEAEFRGLYRRAPGEAADAGSAVFAQYPPRPCGRRLVDFWQCCVVALRLQPPAACAPFLFPVDAAAARVVVTARGAEPPGLDPRWLREADDFLAGHLYPNVAAAKPACITPRSTLDELLVVFESLQAELAENEADDGDEPRPLTQARVAEFLTDRCGTPLEAGAREACSFFARMLSAGAAGAAEATVSFELFCVIVAAIANPLRCHPKFLFECPGHATRAADASLSSDPAFVRRLFENLAVSRESGDESCRRVVPLAALRRWLSGRDTLGLPVSDQTVTAVLRRYACYSADGDEGYLRFEDFSDLLAVLDLNMGIF
ncbi:hypothetical protein DIPPA_00546 [Diplonema papillatum]|nr:hypothetical protein DIPPA_00546 [Diplonema papillatum]